MNTKTLTKKLCIVGIFCLITVLCYSEAFARADGSRRGDRGNRGDWGWNRSYHHNYDRSYSSDFFGFRIGDIVVRLPVEYQAYGAYYERRRDGYIIIPGCGK